MKNLTVLALLVLASTGCAFPQGMSEGNEDGGFNQELLSAEPVTPEEFYKKECVEKNVHNDITLNGDVGINGCNDKYGYILDVNGATFVDGDLWANGVFGAEGKSYFRGDMRLRGELTAEKRALLLGGVSILGDVYVNGEDMLQKIEDLESTVASLKAMVCADHPENDLCGE
ncbi:MAG: hypothetical protein ABH881_03675 [bacterium]